MTEYKECENCEENLDDCECDECDHFDTDGGYCIDCEKYVGAFK
jgi:hypothetical protein